MQVEFFVPGIPIAQPRQRHALIGGNVRNYTPAKHPVNVFKAATAMACRAVFQGEPIEGAVGIEAEFIFPRPKSRKKDVWMTCKPDAENVGKSLLDSLSGVLYRDDAQVAVLTLRKRYTRNGESPGASVKAWSVA